MAKFKVGDKVEYVGPIADFKGMRGVVDTAGGVRLVVKMEDGSMHVATEDKFKVANSSATNAKFKVGDKVTTDRIQALKGKVGTVVDVRDGRVKIRWPYGNRKESYQESSVQEQFVTMANSRACNSTNSIVRNAMAANACAKARAENASAFPPDLWEKLGGSMMAREAAGRLKRGDNIDVLIKRFRDSSIGSQIPGRAADAARVAYALEEMKRRGIA